MIAVQDVCGMVVSVLVPALAKFVQSRGSYREIRETRERGGGKVVSLNLVI